jgi:hypothetical protein
VEALRAEDQKHLATLRQEVSNNIGLLSRLKTGDKSANAVYAPGIRKLIEGLRHTELAYVKGSFDRFLGKKYAKENVFYPAAGSVGKFYVALSLVARKLADFENCFSRIDSEPAAKFPCFYLKRWVDALDPLNKALKIIPLSAKKRKAGLISALLPTFNTI